MSRRSGRLQTKHECDETENECPPTRAIAVRKRKVEEFVLENDGQRDAKRNYEIQSCWSQITAGGVTPCVLIETPQKEASIFSELSRFSQYRFQNIFCTQSPLPVLSWADSKDVWLKLLGTELTYTHSSRVLEKHPDLREEMRSILMDWLMEVSQVYTLHRETFYLAQDFFDRYMLSHDCVSKKMLQLVGVTCLFIAAKHEEIYPPKLSEFAFVTDEACTRDDILAMELVILKGLKWKLNPVTAIAWLNLFLQVSSLKDAPKLLLPQYSQEQFLQMAQLLDLCILHTSSLDFEYRILAASALYHYTSMDVVTKATGVVWANIADCVHWMAPFMKVAKRNPPAKLKSDKKVPEDCRHNIQTHTNYLEMSEMVNVKVETSLSDGQTPVSLGGILTPPTSTEKTTL